MSAPPQVSVPKCCFQSFPQPGSNNSAFPTNGLDSSDQLRKDLGSELSRKDLGSDCNSKASDSGEDTEGSVNTSTWENKFRKKIFIDTLTPRPAFLESWNSRQTVTYLSWIIFIWPPWNIVKISIIIIIWSPNCHLFILSYFYMAPLKHCQNLSIIIFIWSPTRQDSIFV